MEEIFKRRSIRKYTGQEVPDEDIEKILRAGMAAPSARNCQPWHFIVVKDRKVLEEITKVHPYAQMLKEAAQAIIVCGDSRLQELEGYWVQDCSAATENMLLMIESLGLGGVWLGVYPRDERIRGVKRVVGLPENVTPLSIISLGYPAEKKGVEDRFRPDRVHLNRW